MLLKKKNGCEATLAKLRGREVSEETRSKLSAALRGRKLSEETRAKIRAAALGRKPTETTLAKLKGRKLSEETIAKLKGRKLSEETRTKMSEVRQGKIHSESTRAKMKAAASARPGISVEVKNIETASSAPTGWPLDQPVGAEVDRGCRNRYDHRSTGILYPPGVRFSYISNVIHIKIVIYRVRL